TGADRSARQVLASRRDRAEPGGGDCAQRTHARRPPPGARRGDDRLHLRACAREKGKGWRQTGEVMIAALKTIQLPKIPPRMRTPLIVAGYCSFALVAVMLTLFTTLPRDRIRDQIEMQLSEDP